MFLQDYIGNTPLVTLQRLNAGVGNRIMVKLEGNNPAGSVKDRAAYSMIRHAETRGEIKPGDVLVEATSGNTGIALAMVAAMRGYHMILIMPDNMSHERVATMRAFGAEIILVSQEEGMVRARDIAEEMNAAGKAKILDQFANPDNPRAHYETTGPEIWRQSDRSVTHFVSSMGTTGTIMGCSRFFAEVNPEIQIIGVQPTDGSSIPGIRRWPAEYVPRIYRPEAVDRIIDVSRAEAEDFTRQLAAREGIFCGISSGGAICATLRLATEVSNANIVTIICDRGDRYLSTEVFSGR
ncbi:MAG: cysteine synthase CysM [Gammaproteobacteria bacterium]|nr:cysteine synthase CysM [Gammaproteobacteria bacterium]MDH3447049.1 cysteine synthase CysM [Gammaproteobacteria bacterium]